MKSLKILFATAIALSVTNAWADLRKSETSYDVCSPKIHFKLPDNWTTAYLMLAGSGVPFPKADADGWSTIDLGTTKAIDDNSFFINSRNTNACYDGTCFTKKGANTNSQNPRVDGFTCKDVQTDGGNIWIMEHPDPRKAGQVYVKQEKPVVQDFYVLLPQNKMWMSSTPLINENGIDHELYVDTDRCGWYFRRYVDEELPSSVLIHMADDENPYKHAVGMEGENSSNATPIALSAMFSIFEAEPDYKDALYFVVDENIASELPENTKGWFATYPEVEGYCGLELAATIYDTDAQLHPSFSCYSGGYRSQSEGCQATSGTAAQGVDSATAITAINACIGVTQGIVESTLPMSKKPVLTVFGKKCFINNKYFNQLFSYTEGVNEKTYFYMPFYRSANGKWEFDSDYYTSPGLDIPVQGGFYPAEGKTDAMVLAVDPKQKPVPAARTKRNAEGPVFWGPLLRELDPSEQVPIIDLFCKGPGWSKGYDCEGSFAEGEETTERISETLKLGTGMSEACVFGWSCDIDGYAPEGWPMFVQGSETASTGNSSYSHRWTSSEENSKGNGGRNQHFCFESHAKFAFKRGLKFSIRGDDDIWVFINNKLAVDLGGTHLSTPGYVDLDFFMKDAKVDSIYDIDVFFCDRRTTMSNMRISTNIYMYQDEEITDLPTSSSSSAKATSSTSTKSSDSKNAKSSSSVSGSKSKSSSSTTKDSKSSASKNSKSSSSNKNAKSKSSSSTKYYAKPSFHVEMVAPFEFDIVFDDDTPSLAKQYAVMDMKGQVLFTGELSSADTRVKVPTSGSYIVSVGYNYRQVNVK
ncbi:fibro-slime domain-containing protein [Fibrobacter sp.]|uniref:fibro-slime domain-containing protein n=1 Tax=Fibrobacter sp. TaxID=35828 RepID=UPI0025BD2E1C|nr:fibro-slime domain-containing protein [Fibrobacter sp.]MBR3070351.1 fibro-slime domain-containing protein [Fibrobacter sp.]